MIKYRNVKYFLNSIKDGYLLGCHECGGEEGLKLYKSRDTPLGFC